MKENEKIEIVYAEPEDYFSKETRERFFGESECEEEPVLNTEEKIADVIFGLAVADALGVPVEFLDRATLDAYPVLDMMGYGSYSVPAGSFSDDTSMTLASLYSLMRGFNADGMMNEFGLWLLEGKYTPHGEVFDVGNTCYRAIMSYLEGTDATECGMKSESSCGNGSLMRISPAVLYAYFHKLPEGQTEKLIEGVSSLTHAHPRAILACLIYSAVLTAVLDNPSKKAVRDALRGARERYINHPEISHFERLLSDDFEKTERDDIRSTGYVVDTIEASIWCILTTDDYKSCVLKAANLGRDTDTVAAVAGAVAGAIYTMDAIDQRWLDTLAKTEQISNLCSDVALRWGLDMAKQKSKDAASAIVEYLLDMPIGFEGSVWELLEKIYGKSKRPSPCETVFGSASFADGDLFDIVSLAEEEAEKRGIRLDYSRWDGKIAGLPYNLTFVLSKA